MSHRQKTDISGSSYSKSSSEIRNQDTRGTGKRSKCQKIGKGEGNTKRREKKVL